MATTKRVKQVKSTPNELIPKTWPGGFKLYEYSRKTIKFNLRLLVTGFVVYFALDTLQGSVFDDGLSSLLSWVLGTVLTVFMIKIFIAGTKGKTIAFADTYSKDIVLYARIFVASFLQLVGIALSILLLVVPVIYVLPRLAFVTYYIIDKDMAVADALKASWASGGTVMRYVWEIVGVSLLIALLFLTIVGIPFAIYFFVMYSAATAILYQMLKNKSV